MSQTAEYIRRLSELKEGELSRLRGLAGRSLDATLEGFDLFTGLWWPLRAKSRATPRREPSWLVAKLFGAFPVPHIQSSSGGGHSLAEVLGRCEPNDEDGRRRFQFRFDALLCSRLPSLEPHLRWALREVTQNVTASMAPGGDVKGIDWVQLLDDLSIWDRGEAHRRGRDIRDVWAIAYLISTGEKERGMPNVD